MKGVVTRGKYSPFVAFQGARPCQDGRVGSQGQKMFLEQIGVEKFGWVRCQSGKSFHCNLRILSSWCYGPIVNDTGIHCVAQLFFLMDIGHQSGDLSQLHIWRPDSGGNQEKPWMTKTQFPDGILCILCRSTAKSTWIFRRWQLCRDKDDIVRFCCC